MVLYVQRKKGTTKMKVTEIQKGRAVSVEIECYGTPVATLPDTKVGGDGSLNAGGVEVRITGERQADKLVLPDVDCIKGCRVDTACGLHVHIDVRDLTYTQAQDVYLNLAKLQRHLKLLCPESRMNNRYCRWRKNHNTGNRYAAINFVAFCKYQTIEFRCQGGSTEPEKIHFWAELCWQLVQWARSFPAGQLAPSRTWTRFLQLLTPDVANWAAYRRATLWMPFAAEAIDAAKAGMTLTAEQTAAIRETGYSLEGRNIMRQTLVRNARPAQLVFGKSVGRVIIAATRMGLNFVQLHAGLQRMGVVVTGAYIRRHMAMAATRGTNCLSTMELNQLRGAL
jgi:hypothetical protein